MDQPVLLASHQGTPWRWWRPRMELFAWCADSTFKRMENNVSMTKAQKQALITKHARKKGDTGSPKFRSRF
jgi:hypothetical protein